MSEREDPENSEESEPESGAERELLPPDVEAQTETGSAGFRPRLPVPVLIAATFRAEPIDEPMAGRPTPSGRSRFAWAAAIAAAGVLAGGALWAFNDHRSQAGLIAEQANETKALAKTIDALNARLSVIENAKSHDELVELRRSVGEIRSNVASSRDLSGALAQLAQRVEKLDRDESAKVDKLNERVDRETSAQAAELAARIDKLEKKVVASAAPVRAGESAFAAAKAVSLAAETRPQRLDGDDGLDRAAAAGPARLHRPRRARRRGSGRGALWRASGSAGRFSSRRRTRRGDHARRRLLGRPDRAGTDSRRRRALLRSPAPEFGRLFQLAVPT